MYIGSDHLCLTYTVYRVQYTVPIHLRCSVKIIISAFKSRVIPVFFFYIILLTRAS